MEGSGKFNLVCESSEGNANQRAAEEARETGYGTNEILETQTDRHDNIILKQENENLRLENIAMKEALRNTICKKCGGPTFQVDRSSVEQNLMIENARLKEELSRITRVIRQLSGKPSSSLPSPLPHGPANPNNIATESLAVPASRSEIGAAAGGINIPEKPSRYLELASSAMDELMKLGQVNAPLWNRNMETGGETLNFNEYVRSFPPLLGTKPLRFISEASRATGVVSLRSVDLVESLLNADRWREMFPGLIGSCATMEVISEGIGGSRNGVLQLMQAEIQLISPSVSARAMKFIRYTRQQAEGVWAVVDLSVDADRREGIMCRRLPSGCILHDLSNGFSKVTWVEHTEYDERPVHHQYRRLLSSGLGFGAQKWICALLRHCEWLKAVSSPTANYQLDQVTRTCLKGLARRMINIFCAGVCLTGGQRWNLVSNAPRIMTRRSMNGPGEPSGTILSATSSVWIPTTHRHLFDLLLNKDMRCIWDVLCHGNATQNVAHFPMSHDDSNPNSISLLSSDTSTEQNPIMVLQETASDMTGSLIVYAPVDLSTISVLMNNGDTSSVALLPSGLYIVPGSGDDLGAPGGERGSMVTVGFQMLLQDLVMPSLITADTISTVNDLVSRTVSGIKEIVGSARLGG
ncbi:hypothetical protein L1887_07793 [Cichorium endivia]|nr:hypothetical protein L1887_07793 [Cichorium endivia]